MIDQDRILKMRHQTRDAIGLHRLFYVGDCSSVPVPDVRDGL